MLFFGQQEKYKVCYIKLGDVIYNDSIFQTNKYVILYN